MERDAEFWYCKKTGFNVGIKTLWYMYNLYIFNKESLVASEYKVFTFEIKEFEAFSKTSYRQASSQSPVL